MVLPYSETDILYLNIQPPPEMDSGDPVLLMRIKVKGCEITKLKSGGPRMGPKQSGLAYESSR
jgi:hypothetical protein